MVTDNFNDTSLACRIVSVLEFLSGKFLPVQPSHIVNFVVVRGVGEGG